MPLVALVTRMLFFDVFPFLLRLLIRVMAWDQPTEGSPNHIPYLVRFSVAIFTWLTRRNGRRAFELFRAGTCGQGFLFAVRPLERGRVVQQLHVLLFVLEVFHLLELHVRVRDIDTDLLPHGRLFASSGKGSPRTGGSGAGSFGRTISNGLNRSPLFASGPRMLSALFTKQRLSSSASLRLLSSPSRGTSKGLTGCLSTAARLSAGFSKQLSCRASATNECCCFFFFFGGLRTTSNGFVGSQTAPGVRFAARSAIDFTSMHESENSSHHSHLLNAFLQLLELGGDLLRQIVGHLVVVVLLDLVHLPQPEVLRNGEQLALVHRTAEAIEVQGALGRDAANRRFPVAVGIIDAVQDPLENAAVLAEAGPEELAVGVLAEPVDVEDLGRVATGDAGTLLHAQPVLQPKNGRIANGSFMMALPLCSAAAVLSLRMADPMKTPCDHELASYTSGTPCGRRPPKRMAEIGTPSESSHAGSMMGHWLAGAQKRELGCAAGVFDSPSFQGLPSQSVISTSEDTSFSMPSQNTPPSEVDATFVKIMVSMAFGFVSVDVPGATPKKPFSGLIARSWPFESNFIQAMSSPTHSIL
uniref:Uncharacterized protein n=1 Tax=Anopheles atroparvus TaxID=41427 RepID=A0A182JJF7_ANOAO